MILLLGSTLMGTSGCGSILGVLLAPESVVGTAATGVAQAGAQTLSGASLDELSNAGNTVNELNRILQENPDAVNSDRLTSLRDSLQQNSKTTDADQRQIARDPPRPRRAIDTPMPTRKGDALAVAPPGEFALVRRPASRPDTLPSGSALHEDPSPVHTMSLNPVRLH